MTEVYSFPGFHACETSHTIEPLSEMKTPSPVSKDTPPVTVCMNHTGIEYN